MTAQLEAITLDAPLEGYLKPVKDADFRDLLGGAVYIKDAFAYLSRSPEDLGIDADGYPDVVAYCYVDDEMGMCFRCLYAARVEGNVIELQDAFADVALTLRLETMLDALCAPLDGDAVISYAEQLAAMESEHPVDDFTQGMRELAELDGLRNPAFPDVIKTVLVRANENDGYELVWAKPVEPAEGEKPQCVLMSEPSSEAFGVHEGDSLPLTFQKQPDGLIAVALAGGE